MLLNKLKPIFSRTLKLPKNFQLFTSDSKIKLKSFQEGNAKLSYKVIKLISNDPTFQQLEKCSLNQRILNQIQSHQDVSPESIKEISNLFTTGINIKKEKQIFSQQRISGGQILKKDEIDKTEIKKFVFHPTRMVTSQVFKKILNLQNSKELLTGQMGISKTVSAFLFWKLANYIDKYRFSSPQAVPKQYYKIPKVLYWSVQKNDNLKKVEENFLKQTESQYLEAFKNKLIDLKQYYKKFDDALLVVLICDQINEDAKIYRMIQALKEIKERDETQEKKLKQLKSLLQKMEDILKTVLPQFDGILYLSSMLVEDKAVQYFDLSGAGNHQEIFKNSVAYSSQIYKHQNMYDLSDYFAFEFEQRVIGQKTKQLFTENYKQKLRKQCFQYLKANSGNYFFTHRGLRKRIEKNSKIYLENLTKLPNQKQKIDFIVNKFKYLVQQQTSFCGSMFNDSFLKGDHNDEYRLAILFETYHEVMKMKRLEQKKTAFEQKIINKNVLNKWKDEELNKYLDKRIFYFQKDKNYIELQFPLNLTIKILEKQLVKNIKYYLRKYSRIFRMSQKDQLGKMAERFFFMALLTEKADFQIITPSQNRIQFNSIKTLAQWFQSIPTFKRKNKNSQQSQNVQNGQKQQTNEILSTQENVSQQLVQERKQNKQTPKSLYQSQSQQEIIKQKRQKRRNKFQELQNADTQYRRSKNYFFLKSFIDYIKKQISNQKSQILNVLFLPTDVKSQKDSQIQSYELLQKIDRWSKCVDGVLIKYLPQSVPTLDLWAFDLTVGKQAKKKLKDFIKEFIGFQDRQTTEITVETQNSSLKVKVYLNYYVVHSQDFNQNMESQLNKEFGNYIKFKAVASGSQYEVIELQGKENCLLKRIGVLDYDKNIKFINPTEDHALTFQEAVAESQRKRKDFKKKIEQKSAKKS